MVKDGEYPGSVVMKGPGYFAVPPARKGVSAGSILRKQVG